MLVLVGFASGIISGMGIGGGTLLIPALVFLQDMTQQQAQGINLIYFVPTAVIALITHKKKGNIQGDILKPIILAGLLAAVAGALIAVALDATLLKRCFGVFLLIMGILEIRKKE